MKIRYTFNFPQSMDVGGGGQVIRDITEHLATVAEVKQLDFLSKDIDFDVLIYFGCTYFSPEVLNDFKRRGVKIVIYPIFDRMKPLWQMKLLKPLLYFPILNVYSLRHKLISTGDVVIAGNDSEKRDLVEIYNINPEKIHVLHYGINDAIIEKDNDITEDLFINEYHWKDFIFCPAATISERKNQISLIRAIEGTDLKLVLNNTQSVEKSIEEEFLALTKNNPNILCLGKLSLDMLISCYKAAKVSVSVSQAETAGLVNLEAAYLGCNVVVSRLEALEEYVGNIADFVDQNNVTDIREKIIAASQKPYNKEDKQFVLHNYSWKGYTETLIDLINRA